MTPYYERGGIQIFNGDALDILPELRAGAAHLIVTDPPYVIGAVSAGTLASKSGGWGDMMNSARWFRDWYRMSRRCLRQDGALWTFCNWRSVPVVMKAATDAEWGLTSLLVWHKEWIGPGGTQGLRPAYELVALLAMPEFAIPDRGTPDVWLSKWSGFKPSGHPAEKPVALMSRIIAASGALPDSLVIDPFMGSGSVLKAARARGVRAIGIETEERWCEQVASDLQQDVLDFGEVPA
jgi:site-specific DNA-methyltransferase (adenine-specific)